MKYFTINNKQTPVNIVLRGATKNKKIMKKANMQYFKQEKLKQQKERLKEKPRIIKKTLNNRILKTYEGIYTINGICELSKDDVEDLIEMNGKEFDKYCRDLGLTCWIVRG